LERWSQTTFGKRVKDKQPLVKKVKRQTTFGKKGKRQTTFGKREKDNQPLVKKVKS